MVSIRPVLVPCAGSLPIPRYLDPSYVGLSAEKGQ